jgi:hypothetical protein
MIRRGTRRNQAIKGVRSRRLIVLCLIPSFPCSCVGMHKGFAPYLWSTNPIRFAHVIGLVFCYSTFASRWDSFLVFVGMIRRGTRRNQAIKGVRNRRLIVSSFPCSCVGMHKGFAPYLWSQPPPIRFAHVLGLAFCYSTFASRRDSFLVLVGMIRRGTRRNQAIKGVRNRRLIVSSFPCSCVGTHKGFAPYLWSQPNPFARHYRLTSLIGFALRL